MTGVSGQGDPDDVLSEIDTTDEQFDAMCTGAEPAVLGQLVQLQNDAAGTPLVGWDADGNLVAPPLLVELEKVRAELRAARAEVTAAREAAERVRALHTPGPVLNHDEFDCTCGYEHHVKAECLGCGSVLYDDGHLKGRPQGPCPTVAALAGSGSETTG